jgi:hypothetical protein
MIMAILLLTTPKQILSINLCQYVDQLRLNGKFLGEDQTLIESRKIWIK